MIFLALFVALVSSTCLLSGCTLNTQCSTCKTAASHEIWSQYDVSFTCNTTTTSCMPNFNSGNDTAEVIRAACRVRSSSCCVFDDGVATNQAVCDSKTCNVNNGCIAAGQCDVPSATNFRPTRTNCCNSNGGCPAMPTLCNPEICLANSCVPTLRFPNCCDDPGQCASAPSVACLRGACVADSFHPGFKSCRTGIDSQCTCASNADCNDGSICSTNVCNIFSNRCEATFFASSGGSSCCANAAGAPITCSNGDVCRNILGCLSDNVAVNGSLTLLPTFSCIARNEQSVGCCTAGSQCTSLQSSTGSPCIAPVCNFGDNTCNILPNYFSIISSSILPCCRDSIDCEPTGQDGPRCTFLKCNNPLFDASITQTFFTCSTQQLPFTCQEDGVINTNLRTTSMAIDGNCTWACGQPNANVVKLRAKLTNPSSGPNFAAPQYLYNLTVRISNISPVLSNIISSVSLLPVTPYLPPTRFLSPAMFAITQPFTQSPGMYAQKFSLADPISMPIYPDEELTVQIVVTLRTNATALMLMRVHLDANPYDVCTPTLVAGGIAGTDGTPCNSNADLGNILPRGIVGIAQFDVTFPGICSPPCSTVGTTTTTSLFSTTSTKRTTTSPPPTITLSPSPSTSGVSGIAFFDSNGDGFTNVPPETVARNIRINLQSQSNLSDSYTTLTNAMGEYFFTVVPTTSFFLMVVNSTLPFGYRPTIVVNNNLSPRKNQFSAVTLRTITRSTGFNYQGMDLGLALIPPCDRSIPPLGPTGQLDVRFTTSQTSCIDCGSLIKLRSRCSPVKCAGLMTRQFITVEATVSNSAPTTLGFNTLVLRLNSLGVGPLDADARPYVCAEALDISASNAYPLKNSAVSQGGMASIAYGWHSIAVGVDVVKVRAQFVYCAHDVITDFNITAEILSDSCIQTIREWNMCVPSIDIRPCQATLKQSVAPCDGCPPTPSPAPTGPAVGQHTAPLEPTNLLVTTNPYCFEPLCVNSQTFVDLGCTNTTAAMAQCTGALNRGAVLHQVVVINPPFTLPSESGSVVVRYQRHAVNDEQLVCGDRFSGRMPIYVIVDAPNQNQTLLVDKHESALQQTVEFTIVFPPIPPARAILISLVSFECSAHPLNATVTARLVTDRCTDETLCTKTFAPMPSLATCVRYRTHGCTETIDGVTAAGFGAADESSRGAEIVDQVAPYIIIVTIFLLLICGFCVVLFIIRRRRRVESERSNKKFIASRQFNIEEPPPPVYKAHGQQMRRGATTKGV